MNKTFGIVIAVIVVLIAGASIYSTKSKSDSPRDGAMETAEMMGEKGEMMPEGEWSKEEMEAMENDPGHMMKDTEMMKKGEGATINADIKMGVEMTAKDESVAMTKAGSYEAYSPEKIARAASSGKAVLFFRASWCPTCRSLDADIRTKLGEIPAGLTILDVNYDSSSDLKKKYGVTYQHTFVQVDAQGNLIKKWSGSPTLSALVKEVK